jgi:IclR family acetate operon transcriptional repressor
MATNNYITVLDKAMRVLEALRGKREVPLGEIASAAGLIKSSTFRILYTFEHLGYVEKSPGGRYGIAASLHRLTGNHRPSPDLGNLVEPFMVELLGRFQETVNLAVLDAGEVLYIRVRESSHAFRLVAHPGMRYAVHATALGKCLVCQLPRPEIEAILKKHPLRPISPRTICNRRTFYGELAGIRSRGYSVDNQESARGVRCLAAPIYTPTGEVSAAISIAGPATRMVPQRDRDIAATLMETCSKISRLVGYTTVQRHPARARH